MILLLVGKVAFAQEKVGTPNDLDKMYTPDKTSVFNADGTNTSSQNSSFDIKNAIKYNPFLLTRGTVAFFYERFFF